MRNEKNELLNELEQIQPPQNMQELSDEQNERICRMALNQIHEQGNPRQQKNIPYKAQSIAHKPAKRFLRLGMIAAAICAFSAVGVMAAGKELLPMLKEKIAFFEKSASSATSDPAYSVRGDYEKTAEALQVFNAPVGRSVTDAGVTVTLDNVSMDVSGMDLFLTVSGEEVLQQIKNSGSYEPLWSKLEGQMPTYWNSRVNGIEMVQMDASDWYWDAGGNVKLWQHYLFNQVPQGAEIELELISSGRVWNRTGKWDFSLTLDGESVRAGGKAAAPGTYPMPAKQVENDTYDINEKVSKDLNLVHLAIGPRGGVLSAKFERKEIKTAAGDVYSIETEGMEPWMLFVEDDTGRVLQTTQSGQTSGTMNLTAPSPDASKIILTPVEYCKNKEGEYLPQERTVTTEELKNGAEIWLNSLGGFRVEDYSVKDGVISYKKVPFGWRDAQCSEELRPQDDGKITEVESQGGQHSALYSETLDPSTGIITVRYDYYGASDEELNHITEWNYEFSETKLDKEHTVTLDLETVE